MEKEELMRAYFEFIIQYRQVLETGNYQTVTTRPILTFKEPITQEIVALNTPDLSKDEDLLSGVDQIGHGLGKLE